MAAVSKKLNGIYKNITYMMDRNILPIVPKKLHNFWHGHSGKLSKKLIF